MPVVLIATSDSALANIFSAELEALGHEPLWEADGHAAHRAALESQPDLVLLDVTLPVHTGLELAALLRKEPDLPAHLPVLLLTDDAIEPHALEKAGVTQVFPKTHEASALRELLTALENAAR